MAGRIFSLPIQTLTVVVLLTAAVFGQADEKIAAAEKVYDEARWLTRKGTAESIRAGREKYQQAAVMYSEAGEKLSEGKSLIFAGNASLKLSEHPSALDLFGKALIIFRSLGDKEWESTALSNTGNVYDELSDPRKALEFYFLALPLSREVNEVAGQAAVLNNIGAAYDVLGERQKALEFYILALPLYKADYDLSGEATVLGNIGVVYETLGDKKKGIEYFEQALQLWRTARNERGEAIILNNIGQLYNDVGARQKALLILARALKLRRKVGDIRGEAITLNNTGKIYSELRNQTKALEYCFLALPLEQKIGDRLNEGSTLNNIGAAYEHLGQKQKALEYYSLSLPIRTAIGDSVGEALTLNNLMLLWTKLNNSGMAVVYGKKAVNTYQRLRSNIKGLDKATQQNYIESIEYTYRGLADILIRAGRLMEAQSILGLIKDQEYAATTTRSSGDAVENLPYSETESDVAAKIDKLTEFGREHAELRKEQKELGDQFPAERLKRLEQLNADIKIANAEFDKALAALGKADSGVEARTLEIKGEKNLQSALQSLSKELNTGTVALYTVLGTETEDAKATTATGANPLPRRNSAGSFLLRLRIEKRIRLTLPILSRPYFSFAMR